MTFGEKLCKLRKEEKISQETLAEKLNTTRQAISKWENNQGFPEAEKIIKLSNIFGVSTDYLLKSVNETPDINRKGYYVSREKAESWLTYERKSTRNLGIGITCLLLIRVPFLVFPEGSKSLWLIAMALATIGIGIVISCCFYDKSYEYRELKKNILIFDHHYLEELKGRYDILKNKYIVMIIVSFCIILFGATGIVFNESLSYFYIYDIIYTFVAVFLIFILIYSLSMMSAYELLVENQKYTNSMIFRLRKRWNKE